MTSKFGRPWWQYILIAVVVIVLTFFLAACLILKDRNDFYRKLRENRKSEDSSIHEPQGETKSENPAVATLFNFGGQAASPKFAKNIGEMNFDYNEVLQGRTPKFAKTTGSIMLDGGTTSFKGRGYTLTALRKFATVGGVHGLFYGPIPTSDDPGLTEISNKASSVQFYSTEEFQKRFGKKE